MAKTIVITGAGSGIGKACAVLFLAKGWNVALIGRRIDPLEAVAKSHKNALAISCDVADENQVEAAFSQISHHFDQIDVLFNNAGLFTPGASIDQIKLSDWKKLVDVNLTGSFLCARAAFTMMRGQNPQGGRIINNGSISAHSPRPNSSPYTATKHAITGLTKSISLDGRPFNITCGQIDIGNARTELIENLAKSAQAVGNAPEATMDVDHVASSVLHMAELPPESNVLFMTVMASNMPFVGRG
ncbi:MAG: NADP-dependent 3-hydroxy acid dehydrogenase YdfG [Paracoccaceae bacterium]